MSGKFHQPQLWVKKTVNNATSAASNQQTPSSNTTPSSLNNSTTPNIGTSNDQVANSSTSSQPPSPTTSSGNNQSSSTTTTPKVTSTLKHNATPFTPQNFVPLSQKPPQPVPVATPPPQQQPQQPQPKAHPKKNQKKHKAASNQANNQSNNNNNNQQQQQGNVGTSNNNQQHQQQQQHNNNNEQYYGSLLKNKTKVIIRNIPYNFTEQDFLVKCVPKSFVSEQVVVNKQQPVQPPVTATTTTTTTTATTTDPTTDTPSAEPTTPTTTTTLPEIPHFIYDPKKITWSDFHAGHKTITRVFSSIAYLNFASVALLHQFKKEFNEELRSKQSLALSSSVQITDDDVDESPLPSSSSITTTLATTSTNSSANSFWRDTTMSIEYCPLQMVPKQKKKDPRDGTIFKDEHYLKFLEQLKQPKDLTLQPLSLDGSSTNSGIGLDCGESSDGSSSTSSRKLGTNIPLALGGVGASSSYTKKTDEPIISPLLKELLEKKNKKGNSGNANTSSSGNANQSAVDPNKQPKGNKKSSGKFKRKY